MKPRTTAIVLMVVTAAIVTALLVQNVNQQRNLQLEFLRGQGNDAVNLLASQNTIGLDESANRKVLDLVVNQQADAFAYITLSDAQMKAVEQRSAPSIRIPPYLGSDADFGSADSGTGNNVQLLNAPDGQVLIEFSAFIMNGSKPIGRLRIGSYQLRVVDTLQTPLVLAMIVLPGALIAVICWLLLSSRSRGSRELSETTQRLLAEQGWPVADYTALSREQGTSAAFQEFLSHAANSADEVQDELSTLQTSHQVIHYKHSRIQSVVEAFPAGVIVFDESGSIQCANAKLASLFNVGIERLTEETLASWSPSTEIFQYLARCSDPANKALPELRVDLPQERRNINVSLKSFPLFANDGQGSNRGNLVIVTDCSKELAAEASREEFVAHISHELKTPLNTLVMYSEALLGEDGRDEQFRVQGLNIIYDEAERMAELINNLLSITKIEMGSMDIERTRVRFNEFVTDAYNVIRKASTETTLQFQIDLPNDDLNVAIDKSLMRIALNNLLTNAVKYNREGGLVRLEVEDLEEAIRVKVSDSGIGIAANDAERIFDKFYRSDSNEVRDRSGHGLGLSLANDIVKLHNGQLTVDSEPGEGTTFTIELFKEAQLLRDAG